MTEMRQVQLPVDLCRKVEKQFGHAFGSLEELVEFVLRDLVQSDAAQADQQELALVEQRLRDLGYL